MTTITKLEKAALITTGAAAAFKTLLWSLEASIDSTEPWIAGLRVLFAFLSFVAFDLVIAAVVFRGWSVSGAAALLVAAAVSAAIALDVARVLPAPALHAAPALTLAAFGLHLMISRKLDLPSLLAEATAPLEAALASERTARQAAEQQAQHITQAVQVHVGGQLPPTVSAYIQARAAELPGASPEQVASAIGMRSEHVRRILAVATPAEQIEAATG